MTSRTYKDTAIDAMLGAVREDMVDPRHPSAVTQGLYARTVLAPPGEPAGLAILQKDPNYAGVNGTGRLWGRGLTTGKIGYTDDCGATFTGIQAPPAGSAGTAICQLEITSGVAGGDYMFALFNSNTANQGTLWRAPAPGATPTSLTFTLIQANDITNNLVNGPGGAPGRSADGSNYRNQSFAIQPDGSYAYLVPYSAGTNAATFTSRSGMMGVGSDILYLPAGGFKGSLHGQAVTIAGAGAAGATLNATVQRIYSTSKAQLDVVAQTAVTGAVVAFPGAPKAGDLFDGPYVRTCANPCAASPAGITWAVSWSGWGFARHGHAIKVINGIPWVSLGDYPYPVDTYGGSPPVTHVGVWAATTAAATAWNVKMLPTLNSPYYGINFIPVTVGGQKIIILEADGSLPRGPIILPTQSNATGVVPSYTTAQAQPPAVTTMRSMVLTSDGNLMWYGTGEGGAIGPVDAIFIAAPPSFTPIMLEQMPLNSVINALNATECGPYVFMGNMRITKEKFHGQA